MFGCLELGGRAGLALEALDIRRRGQHPGANQLHCDDGVQPGVPRFIDDAHAAACDLFEQFVFAELAWRAARQQSIFGDDDVEGSLGVGFLVGRVRQLRAAEAAGDETARAEAGGRVGRHGLAAFGACGMG